MEASSALGSVFDNKLYTTILERGLLQRRVLNDDDWQSLFAVLRIWPNLEWPQLECFIGYVTSDPEWALRRITRIHMILHTLRDQGFMNANSCCSICGGPGCHWCNKKKCILPLNAPGKPMNKDVIRRRFEAGLRQAEVRCASRSERFKPRKSSTHGFCSKPRWAVQACSDDETASPDRSCWFDSFFFDVFINSR